MQAVTDALGTSVGGIYLYFKTKESLVAELQRESLSALHTSYLLGQSRLATALEDDGVDAGTAALARVVATARFWVAAERTIATDVELSRRIFDGQRTVVRDAERSPVLPAAIRLLEEVRRRFDDAVDAGALEPADNLERAVITISSVNGVLLASKVGRWDEARFDGRRLAHCYVTDLFVGWGADRERLDAARGHVDAFEQHQQLAPQPGAAGRPVDA